MAALLPPAAGEATRGRLLRAVAVASHAALLIIAAWIHLLREKDAFTQSIYSVYERSHVAQAHIYLNKCVVKVHHLSDFRLNEQLFL